MSPLTLLYFSVFGGYTVWKRYLDIFVNACLRFFMFLSLIEIQEPPHLRAEQSLSRGHVQV